VLITSVQNNRIKNILKLYRQRQRNKQQQTLVEGYRAVRRALQNDYPLEELYVCPSLFLGENENELIHQIENTGVTVFEVSEAPFRKIATQARPDGLLAVAPQRRNYLTDHTPDDKAFYLIVESIERPGNLGAIIRSADAAGVSALVICEADTDVFNPDVIRASVGTVFAVPIFEASTNEAISWCQQHNIQPLAATPHTDTVYTQVNMKHPIAIVVGSEKYGLSETWLQQTSTHVSIPMHGQADSLNVATAATLLLFEVIRQLGRV
jgi:RNA methyltransferase, TrmH family